MADYFDRLELELRGAVPRATSDPRAYPLRSRRRPRPGNLVVGLSVAVTVAVVVLAVALVGHAHTTAHASPPASSAPVAPVATPVDKNRHRISDVLTGDGIGRVRFGQSRVAVIAAVTRLLGPSSTGLLGPSSTGYMRVEAECGVDHAMTWVNGPAFRLRQALPARPEADRVVLALAVRRLSVRRAGNQARSARSVARNRARDNAGADRRRQALARAASCTAPRSGRAPPRAGCS